jgi:Arc/MetJ family transcription regulator
MSIFSKSICDITATDLDELLLADAVENVRLEFKREIPNRDEMLKKISSFANTYGGFIVIGAEADSKDGRIRALPGVDPQPSFKQTIVQWCAGGVSPLIQVEVSDPLASSAAPGRVCYVIYTAESDLAPHFLTDRRGLWIRTNEFSSRFDARLANETELAHLTARRQQVKERCSAMMARARQRFHTFTDRRYQELTMRASIGSRFSLAIVPRFPTHPLCDQSMLRSILKGVKVPWREVGFPRDSLGTVSQHESELVLRPGSAFSLLEANIWGLLFYASEMDEQVAAGQTGIHVNRFLGQVMVFLKHAQDMLPRLGYVGPLVVEIKLEGICGAQWIFYKWEDNPAKGPVSDLDDEVSFSLAITTDDLALKIDGVARDLLRLIFFAMNWSNMAESDQALMETIKAGYKFNMWTIPEALNL